jgi:hypothetical protein
VPITASVGRWGKNNTLDVLTVETLLARHRRWLDPMPALSPDTICNAATEAAIIRFQTTACAMEPARADGLVIARGFVIEQLERGAIPVPRHAVFTPMSWMRPAGGLTRADFAAAALSLGCEREAIEAVATQEAGDRGPWDEVGRPTILFERHKFARHSAGRYNVTHPDISNPNPGGYGRYRVQYDKLYRAAILDETAALKAASWGTFQILGENHAACGFASVDAFVDTMLKNEAAHLAAFIAFVRGDPNLRKALQDKNWARFAMLYNGPQYKKNAYDTKMAAHYARLKMAGAGAAVR